MKTSSPEKSVRVYSTLVSLAILLIVTSVRESFRTPSFSQVRIGASALASAAAILPIELDRQSYRDISYQAIPGLVTNRVQRDLGFRPARDGYSFANSAQVTPDCQSFRQSFSGLDIQCSNGQPQERYHALFERFKFSFGTGVCTGMAVTSLAYYVGIKAPPRPTPTFSLTIDQAWPHIATFHGRQYSKAVLDRLILGLSAWNTTDARAISQRVDKVYNQLVAAIRPGNPDPLVLDLVARPGCDAPGHTVVPYRLDETDPLHPKVYIYENYSAGDSTKFIAFDFSSPDHRFSYWKWDSAACSALIALPISAFVGPEDKIPSQYLGRYN